MNKKSIKLEVDHYYSDRCGRISRIISMTDKFYTSDRTHIFNSDGSFISASKKYDYDLFKEVKMSDI